MPVKLNGVLVGNKAYPNGERMFDDIAKNIKEHDKIVVTMQYQGSVDFEILVMLISYINTLDTINYSKTLNMWYVPYLRMDRQVGTKDPMIKGIIRLFKSISYGWTIYVLDLHNEKEWRMEMNGHKCTRVELGKFIDKILDIENIDIICYPDQGALNKYTLKYGWHHVYNYNKLPYVNANKVRDIDTGEISKIELECGECVTANA